MGAKSRQNPQSIFRLYLVILSASEESFVLHCLKDSSLALRMTEGFALRMTGRESAIDL